MSDFEDLEQTFQDFAEDDRKLSLEEFQKAFDLSNAYLRDRLFVTFDVDKTGGVNFQEFQQGLRYAQEDQLRFAFQLHDNNDDGCIDKQELTKFIRASLREAKLDLPIDQLQQLRDILLDKADTDKNDEISLPEFKALLKQSPRLQDVMSVSPAQWLQPPAEDVAVMMPQENWLRRWHALQNSWVKILFLLLFIGINIALFLYAYTLPKYAFNTDWYRLARGCGLALNFDGALVLVPVMRRWITWLRKTKLNEFLPIDEHIQFHKLVGHVIFVLSLVHTIAHIINHRLDSIAFPIDQFLLSGSGNTGLLLMLILLLLWVTALPCVREKGQFNLFAIMHSLYIPWIAILLFHGPNFWGWSSVSIAAFLVEQVVRRRRSKRETHVVNAQVLPSNVLALDIARPFNFSFRASDYLYLRCPSVADYEWHPFTISSAPEREDSLSLHIRAVGGWTGSLYSQFRDWTIARDSDALLPKIPVYLDGPYHSPSSHIYQSQHAVLIAGGIGVTPYASILQSILHQRQAQSAALNLKKVHFYWFNRNKSSFEWFLDLLQTLEAEDIKGHLDLFDFHLYLTGTPENNLQLMTLYVAMDLLHHQHQVDLITKLKNQIQAGRPDWDDIFKQLKEKYPSEPVDVFYCGPRGLSRSLRQKCNRYGFSYRKENF